MQIRILITIIGFFMNTAWADFFADSSVQSHPVYPADGPFILEISGQWPSDCHPGEQRPVVRAFDENSVTIVFEIVVEHVTCNQTPTPYRALVDLSELVRTGIAFGDTLDVAVEFGEATLQQTVPLVCSQSPCPDQAIAHQKFVPGLYRSPELDKEGILLARQNTGMAVIPLSYDESGNSEWLIAGGHMTRDSFFGEILRASGGECFACEPTGALPQLESLGFLSVLVDGPDLLQVKLNDGPFMRYEALVYGYGGFRVGPNGERLLVDIGGRWGISENRGDALPVGDLTDYLPGAFDVVVEDIVTADPQIQQDGQVRYLVSSPVGETLGQLVCKGQTSANHGANICEYIDPTDAAEPLFLFYQIGHSSLSIEYGRQVGDGVTAPGGKAVRLD